MTPKPKGTKTEPGFVQSTLDDIDDPKTKGD